MDGRIFFIFFIFLLIEKTLLLVQLLAIDKIGSTKQTFSQIISFLGVISLEELIKSES